MEQKSEMLDFMQSEVQFFKDFLSEVASEPIEMVEITLPKQSRNFIPKKKLDSTRWNKETNTYNNKPIDPNYFNSYFHEKNIVIICDVCGQETKKLKLARHKKTNKCIKLGCSNIELNGLD